MGYVSPRSKSRGVAAYNAFGQKASAAILSQISMLPASHRQKNLKLVLNKIDPSLWGRTQTIAKRYQAQGAPPGAALQQGLARAMSTGLASEVVKLGQRGDRTVPKKGLMGLGAYGPASLGAAPGLVKNTSTISQISSIGLTTVPPTEGQCDPTGQLIWRGGTWTRIRVNDVCSGTYQGVTITTGGAQGGVTVTDTATGAVQTGGAGLNAVVPGTLQMMQVGPFTVPLGAELTIHWSGLLPDDWIAFMAAELAQDCKNCVITSMENATPGHPMGALRDFMGAATPSMVNKDLVSIGPKPGSFKVTTFNNGLTASVASGTGVYNWPDQPIAQCTRPDNGEVWGFYLNIVPQNLALPWDSSTNPYVAVIGWRKAPTGVWDWIKSLIGTVINWVGDALSAIGDAACSLLSTPEGHVGATVAGAVVGAEVGGVKGAQLGAAAGSAGAAVATSACGNSPVCPPGTVGNAPNCIPVQTTPSWLLPVAVGGAGILLILAVTGKKKKKKASTAP